VKKEALKEAKKVHTDEERCSHDGWEVIAREAGLLSTPNNRGRARSDQHECLVVHERSHGQML
jgi:hypothetical protein